MAFECRMHNESECNERTTLLHIREKRIEKDMDGPCFPLSYKEPRSAGQNEKHT